MTKLTEHEVAIVINLANQAAKRYGFPSDALTKMLLTAKVQIHQEEPYTFAIVKKSYKKKTMVAKAFAKYNYGDIKIGHAWSEEIGRETVIVRAFRKLIRQMEKEHILKTPVKTTVKAVVGEARETATV